MSDQTKTECDCVLGTITQRDDYNYDFVPLRMSEIGDGKWISEFKGDFQNWFEADNFCRECGKDVRTVSADLDKRISR